MNSRLHVRFPYPLAVPGIGYASRVHITIIHLALTLNALGYFFGQPMPWGLLPASMLLLLEVIRRKREAIAYIKQAFFRIALHTASVSILLGSMFIEMPIEVRQAAVMIYFCLFFLSLYDAILVARGSMGIQFAYNGNNNKK